MRVTSDPTAGSTNTVGNAVSALRYVQAQGGIDAVGVVTLPYHIRRATDDFRRILTPLVEVVSCPPPQSVYGLAQAAYLRAKEPGLSFLDKTLIGRNFNPENEDTVTALEARLSAGRYAVFHALLGRSPKQAS